MKKLILFSLFASVSIPVLGQEMVDHETGKELVSTIKDIEIKDMLSQTSEFKECRDKNVFKAGESDSVKNAKIKEAEDCFKQKLSNKNNGEELKKLSQKLNLQNYGLVKSNNVKDIQSYLSDKMYESMTGINRKEADRKKLYESMKFGNKKHIDQKVFITLYKSQLSKNALYEISRYCFQDLRHNSGKADTNFGAHWGSRLGDLNVGSVNDLGDPVFGQTLDTTDKSKIYDDLFKSMNIGGQGFPTAELNKFFMRCGFLMGELCEQFKTKSKEVKTTGESDVGAQKSNGAASCLARNRLQEYKKGMASADLIEKEFDKMSANQLQEALLEGKPVKIFGKGADDESLDSLTNYSSKDILEGGYTKNANAEKSAEECEKNPEFDSCKDFFTDGESLDKAKHAIDSEMTLKREVELARVRELKKQDKAKLEEYLSQNGFFNILEKLKANPNLPDAELENLISSEFEAKKVAVLSEINSKIGKRQSTKTNGQGTIDKTEAKNAVQESKEERARLAQVVLFNNIITSHLRLERKDASGKTEGAGRNINAWKKEEAGLKSAQVNDTLFSNLKATDDGKATTGMAANEQIGGEDFIDEILGKKKQP